MDFIQTVELVEKQDPDGARELVRLAIYETLCDYVDADRDAIMEDLTAEVIAKNAAVRRGLVREFIDTRLSKGDVEPLLDGAVQVTLVDHEVAKAFGLERKKKSKSFREGRSKEREWWNVEPRDAHGMWTRSASASRMLDPIDALTKDPGQGQWKGQGQAWNNAGRSDRLRRVGNMLASTDNKHMQAAGQAAQVIGALGPEAQEVLGHHLKRTAYRYRGTERRPDRTLLADTRDAMAYLDARRGGSPEQKRFMLDQIQRAKAANQSWAPITQHWESAPDMSRDQKDMAIEADISTAYLMDKVPNLKNAELSQAAGKTPPSQGIMIDADGDMVSQAMGYNGDHYLPFDLKNLKRMHGGQYIRTRNLGGPTTEDIYTGLVTGTRQITVVSNSGVFTLEFDPDLRGGRRYSDKAREMVDRYAQILEAVKGGKVKLGEISAERKSELRTEALRDAHGNPDLAQSNYNDALEREEKLAQFNYDVDEDAFGEEASRMATEEAQRSMETGVKQSQHSPQAIARRAKEIQRDLQNQAADTRFRRVTLDGDGYHRAMLALQEEFPFYIRSVKRERIEDFVRTRGIHDPKADVLARRTSRSKDSAFVSTAAGQISFKGKTRAERLGQEEEAPKAEGDTTTGGGTPAARAAAPAPGKPIMGLHGKSVYRHPETVELSKTEVDPDDKAEVEDALTGAMRYADSYKEVVQGNAAEGKGDIAQYADSPPNLLAFLNAAHGGSGRRALQALQAAPENVQRKVMKTLTENAQKVADDISDPQAARDAMSKLPAVSDLLELKTPFRAASHTDRPDSDDERPIAVPEIVALGNVPANYDAYYETAKANTAEPDLADLIDDARAGQNHVKEAYSTYKKVKEDANGDLKAPAVKQADRHLQEAHAAYAFAHAEALAKRFGNKKAKVTDLGKDPASQEAGQTPGFGFQKAYDPPSQSGLPDLSWISPESQLGRDLLAFAGVSARD